jgi:hypothetical protein
VCVTVGGGVAAWPELLLELEGALTGLECVMTGRATCEVRAGAFAGA